MDGQRLLYGDWASEAHVRAHAREEQRTLQELHCQCVNTQRQQGEEAQKHSDADLHQAEDGWTRSREHACRLREEVREETDNRRPMI